MRYQIKLYPGFQRPLKIGTNRTSGSARHPFVLCIQSEASIPILGHSVIGRILTGDPIFTNQCFGSTSNSCEKLRSTVICSTTRLQPGIISAYEKSSKTCFSPQASYALSCFDIMVKDSRAFFIYNIKQEW